MSNARDIVCINCPMGCRLTVTETENGGWLIEGNQCKRGHDYAIREVTAPTRMLTSTVKVRNGFLPRLPVRTKTAIPKEKIFDAMKVVNHVVVDAPVKMGDVIVRDLLGTGVDLIASRDI